MSSLKYMVPSQHTEIRCKVYKKIEVITLPDDNLLRVLMATDEKFHLKKELQ